MIIEVVGAPGSGKTSFVKGYCSQSHQKLLSDEIGFMIRAISVPVAIFVVVLMVLENRSLKEIKLFIRLSVYLSAQTLMVIYKSIRANLIISDQYILQFIISLKLRGLRSGILTYLLKYLVAKRYYKIKVIQLGDSDYIARARGRSSYSSSPFEISCRNYRKYRNILNTTLNEIALPERKKVIK